MGRIDVKNWNSTKFIVTNQKTYHLLKMCGFVVVMKSCDGLGFESRPRHFFLDLEWTEA